MGTTTFGGAPAIEGHEAVGSGDNWQSSVLLVSECDGMQLGCDIDDKNRWKTSNTKNPSIACECDFYSSESGCSEFVM